MTEKLFGKVRARVFKVGEKNAHYLMKKMSIKEIMEWLASIHKKKNVTKIELELKKKVNP